MQCAYTRFQSETTARQAQAIPEEGSVSCGHCWIQLLTTPCLQLQVILDREHEIAKQHLAAGYKDRALVALRRRKYQESLLLKTDGQLQGLEELVSQKPLNDIPCHASYFQVSTIEFSLVEVSVLHGLKQGNEVLKEIHKEMNIESVEKLLDETAEARAYQRVRSLYFETQRFSELSLENIGNRRNVGKQPYLGRRRCCPS